MSFYTLVRSLLHTYTREQIFLRTSQSLGHTYKEIDVPIIQERDSRIHNDTHLSPQSTQDTHTTTNNTKHTQKSLESNPTQALLSHTQTPSEDSQKFIEVMTYFFVLLGNQSPLPNYILDKFANNQDDNEGFSLFFDFFNNHFLWLLYESATLRNYPRSFSQTLDDRISQIVLALLGLHDIHLAKEYLPFAPLVLSLRRPKPYIERVLQYNLKLTSKVEIIENIPQQIPILPSQKNILGQCNNTLSKHFVLGSTSLSYQNKICIALHNVSYYEALLFLPTQTKYNKLKESIIFLINNTLSVDVSLHTKYHKKMHLVLGDKTCARLGCSILGDMAHTQPQSHYIWLIPLCE